MNLFLVQWRTRLWQRAFLAAIIIFLTVCFGLIKAPRVAAINNNVISNSFPLDGSSDVLNSSGGVVSSDTRPWLAVGVGEYDGEHTYVKIYVPDKQSANITIQNGQGICNGLNSTAPPGDNTLDVGFPTVDYHLSSLGDTEEYFAGNLGNPIDQTKSSRPAGISTCGTVPFTISANDGIESTIHPGVRVFYLEATIKNPSGSGDNEKNFRVIASSGVMVGVSRPVRDYPQDQRGMFGIYQRNAPQLGGPMWNFAVQLAPRCQDNFNTSWSIYDADNGVYSPQNISADLQKSDINSFSWGNQATYSGATLGGNQALKSFGFSSALGNRYRLYFHEINYHNTIQLLVPYDEYDAQTAVEQKCNPTSGYSFSCTTNPPGSLDNLNPSQAETIRVTAKNTGSNSWDPSANNINMHKVVDGSDQGYIALQNSSTGGSTVNPGNQTTFSFNATASASYDTTKTYVFQMYVGGKPMGGSTCTTKLTTKKKVASPYGYITMSCTTTTVYLKTSAQDTYTKSESASYQTSTPPNIPPSTWFSPPANNPGGKYKYSYTKDVTVTENPATKIPYEIDFFDNGTGAKVGQQQGVFDTNNGTATQPWDTFKTWNPAFLWPHNGYTAKLSAQVTGSFNRDGPYNYTQTSVDSDSMDPCLTVKYENGYSTVCIDGTTADLEPGDSNTFNYKIGVFNNATNQTFDTNQNGSYSFSVSTNGGFVYTGLSPPNSDPIPPGNSVINIPVQIRADWEGGFTLNFRFRGTTLGSGTWNGTWDGICSHNPTCPASGPCDTVATRPYFKSFYGDMKAGGAFLNQDGTCTTDCSGNAGSILGYGYPLAGYNGGPRGASTDFGAFALGLLEGDDPTGGGYCGFYDSAINNAKYNNLSFANTGVGLTTSLSVGGVSYAPRPLYGGYMAGAGAPAGSDSYVPDYFDKEAKTSSPNFEAVSSITDINNPPDPSGTSVGGQYFYAPTAGTLTIDGGTLGNKQTTLFVKGNVYISGNLTYASWNPLDASTIPYLTIIAEGNIIVDHGVSQINGLYIAQGDGVTSGVFATCGGLDSTGQAVWAHKADISQYCRSQLVINGSVIAALVKPYRSNGTLENAPTGNSERPNSDNACSSSERPASGNACNTAEIFNYSPALILGQPNFQSEYSGAVTPGQLQGVFSLPPVF